MGHLFRVCVWIIPTALKINIWNIPRGQNLALYVAVQGTEQLYLTDNTGVVWRKTRRCTVVYTATCPDLIGYPYPLALCKEPFGSQTQGLFSKSPASITHSVFPTLADWIQTTSCCGDVCVGACKVGGADRCVMGGRARCYWEPLLTMHSKQAPLQKNLSQICSNK